MAWMHRAVAEIDDVRNSCWRCERSCSASGHVSGRRRRMRAINTAHWTVCIVGSCEMLGQRFLFILCNCCWSKPNKFKMSNIHLIYFRFVLQEIRAEQLVALIQRCGEWLSALQHAANEAALCCDHQCDQHAASWRCWKCKHTLCLSNTSRLIQRYLPKLTIRSICYIKFDRSSTQNSVRVLRKEACDRIFLSVKPLEATCSFSFWVWMLWLTACEWQQIMDKKKLIILL